MNHSTSPLFSTFYSVWPRWFRQSVEWRKIGRRRTPSELPFGLPIIHNLHLIKFSHFENILCIYIFGFIYFWTIWLSCILCFDIWFIEQKNNELWVEVKTHSACINWKDSNENDQKSILIWFFFASTNPMLNWVCCA